jgi:predicted short-subunit dehydrogenase-like oxidoreductase (DUF2520 family)
MEARPQSIGIIGAGRLGASLALALEAAGYRVAAVASRSAGSAASLAARLGEATALSSRQVTESCDLVFITVPDDQIASVAAELPWSTGRAAVHCSGALALDALAPASAAGAQAGCLHPLQSFSSRDGEPERFRGIVCGVEGAAPLGSTLERIAAGLGAGVVRLEGVDRARYHAAAVFASNYAVALMAAARRAWELAGLPPDEARPALAPLLLGAASNVSERELAEALTGPIARGDVATIERQLAALDQDRELLELYRRLGAELLRLDLRHPPDAAERLRALLSKRDEPASSAD